MLALHGRGIWPRRRPPLRPAAAGGVASFYALIVEQDGAAARRAARTAGVPWGLYAFWSALGLVNHATYLLVFAGQRSVVAAWLGSAARCAGIAGETLGGAVCGAAYGGWAPTGPGI
jgi:hypothetical protein